MVAVVEFRDVHKAYRLGAAHRNLRETLVSLSRRLRDRRWINDRPMFWALKGVSFDVERGETLGLIGPNGAGKTTILKLLSKVTRPTRGHVAINGRFVGLIELGAGFHPDLSGRDNIYLNGAILGLSRREIDERFDSIVAFSELANFLDTPVKRYSSGMYVRLGFSVAAHVDLDVLLIDEVLAVGDQRFKDKCIQRINTLRNAGKSMIIVSHHDELIKGLCDRVLLLNRGEVVFQGKPQEVFDWYYKSFTVETGQWQGGHDPHRRQGQEREIEIIGVSLLDAQGQGRLSFVTGEAMVLTIHFRVNTPVNNPVFDASIRQGFQTLHSTTTARFNIKGDFIPGDTGVAKVHYRCLNLLGGEYNFSVCILRDHFSPLPYDVMDNAVSFTIGSHFHQGGSLVYIEHEWEVVKAPPCVITHMQVRDG